MVEGDVHDATAQGEEDHDLLAEGDADVVDGPAGVGDQQDFGCDVEAGDCLPAGVL